MTDQEMQDFRLWGYDLKALRSMCDFAWSHGWKELDVIDQMAEDVHRRLFPSHKHAPSESCGCGGMDAIKTTIEFVRDNGKTYGYVLKP